MRYCSNALRSIYLTSLAIVFACLTNFGNRCLIPCLSRRSVVTASSGTASGVAFQEVRKLKNDEMASGDTSIFSMNYTDIDGKNVSMEKYRGHVTIFVNVASKWGKTPVNYTELTALYNTYSESKGFRIIGFPCNQFGNQEPGTDAEIKKFAEGYGVMWDLSTKIDVNGKDTHPIWVYLKSKQGGTLGNFIKWNFTKFVMDKEGNIVKRYGPPTMPKDMEKDLLELMNKK